MTERTEERDFRRFRKNGDPEAMARVFDAVAPKLLLVAGHLTRDAAEAEDLVQTTFLAALEGAADWDGVRPLVPWLVGILSHRATDLRRRNQLRRTEGLGEVEGDLDPLELVSDRETRESIAQAVDALEEPYREVLILRVAHGLEPTDIAHTLGRSPGTVRMQLKRGREKLERALPQGLSLPAFLLVDAGRGLAAVREVVLAKASTAAAATVSVGLASVGTIGGLAMKAGVAAVGVFGLGVIVWALLGPRAERQGPALDPGSTQAALEGSATELEPVQAVAASTALESRPRRVAARARGVEMAVRVVFEEDGTPAAGVGVYVRPLAQAPGTPSLGFELRTDEGGTARLDDLARGSYSIDLDRWELAPVTVELQRGRTVELAIPDGVDVEGSVVDPEGNAVPGADVYRLNDGHHDYLQWIATADSAGLFRLRDVALSTAFVARAEGYQPSVADGKGGRPRMRDAKLGGSTEVRLELGARGHRIFGHVVDAGGRAVPHARLVFAVEEDTREDGASSFEKYREPERPADLEAFSIRADEEGLFSTRQVPAGSVTWFAQAVDEQAGVGVGSLEVAAGGEQELAVVLGPGAGVVGILTDENGSPVQDYVVQHEWRGSLDLGQLEHDFGMRLANRSTRTAEDGSFQLLGLLPGETGLEVQHPSGDTLARERLELELGELETWTPQIRRLSNLTVRILGPDGEPLVGWGVGLCRRPSTLRHSGNDGAEASEGFVPNITDEEGRHTFQHVRPRAMTVTAHTPTTPDSRELPPPVAVVEGVHPGSAEVVVTVPHLPNASVRGRILDAAGLVPERTRRRDEKTSAEVQLRFEGFDECGTLRLDENGGFALGQLPAGSYALLLTADDFPREYELLEFELGKGQDLDLGIVTPSESAYAEVRLEDEDGNPLEGLELVLIQDGEELWQDSRRDRDSRAPGDPIRIGPLAPGSYQVVASQRHAWDYAPVHGSLELTPGLVLQRTLTLKRGREQAFELGLPPHPNEEPRKVLSGPNARIEFQLFDAERNFLLRRRDHHELFDVSGNRLRLAVSLAPGTYRAFFEDHRDPALRRPRPAAEVEFTIPETGEPDVLVVELE